MKILIISNLYPPHVLGGAEIVAARMAEGLRSALQHVTVMTTMPYRSLRSLSARPFDQGGMRVYRFFPLNLYHYAHGSRFPAAVRAIWHLINLFNLHSAWQVWRVLRRERPDVVIGHNLMGFGFVTPLVVAVSGFQYVQVLHDVQLITPSGIILKDGERSLAVRVFGWIGYRRYMKWLFKRASILIAPSAFLFDVYRRYGFFTKQRTIVLPNPVIVPEPAVRQAPGPELRLLYVGQVSQAKGVVGLVETLHRSDVAFKLTIVGAGAALERCVRIASGDARFAFFGWQPRKFITALLAVTDAVVAPTLCYDTSPTIVFEALSYGVPVLASDLGGAKEVVRMNYNGWLFEAGNWDQLRALIQSLALDREKISRAATNARLSVAGYSTEHYIDRLLTLCQNERP